MGIPNRTFPSALALAAAASALLLTSCATLDALRPGRGAGKPAAPAFPEAARAEDIAAADAAYATGKSRLQRLVDPLPVFTPDNGGIVVELDQQRAYLYHDNTLVAVSRISSGRRNHRTETGTFTVGSKNRDHRSNVYGDFVGEGGSVVVANVDARIDQAPAGTTYRGSSMANFLRLHHDGRSTPIGFHAGVLPGHPASHGCLRLPRDTSVMLYDHIPIGFPVIIRGEKYGVPFGTRQAGTKRAPKSVPPTPPPTPAEDAPISVPAPEGMPAAPAQDEGASPETPGA